MLPRKEKLVNIALDLIPQGLILSCGSVLLFHSWSDYDPFLMTMLSLTWLCHHAFLGSFCLELSFENPSSGIAAVEKNLQELGCNYSAGHNLDLASLPLTESGKGQS